MRTAIAIGVLVPLLSLAPAPVARADEARAQAKITCDRAAEPGRVRCEVELRAPPGAAIRWADVVITRAPAFASALRGRAGPAEATTREDAVWRWAIALAARSRGEGSVEARVRFVACTSAESCAPSQIDATGAIVVGP